MKKIFILLSLILSAILLFTFGKEGNCVNILAYAPDSVTGNWNWGYQSSFDFDTYYKMTEGVSDKETLKQNLHTILTTGIKNLGYNGAYNALDIVDSSPNDSSKIICMYTGKLFSTSAHGASGTTTWNREHTWAKSHGFKDESGFYAYCDINHLRATECQINSSRSNSDFGEVDHSSAKSDSYGNFWTSTTFEPRDAVKGDVARIMMYMTIRYIGSSTYDNGVKLTLVNGNTSGSTLDGKFGDLATLKRWHEEDPVDDLERRRNDLVYSLQGNRNPFIDHPEYANIIFGTNYSSEETNLFRVQYSVDSDTVFTYSDTTKYEAQSLIKEPSIIPLKEGYEFLGWYQDSTLTKAWNFSSDKINANLVLYPKFVEKVLTPTEKFMLLKAVSSLQFNYLSSSSDGKLAEEKELTISPTSGSGALNGLQLNEDIDLNKYFSTEATADFDFIAHTNGKANFYIKPNKIRLYNAAGNGSSLEIKAHDGITITNLELVENKNLDISIEDGKAIISNKNSATSSYIEISGFKINYLKGGSKVNYTCEAVNMRFLYKIPATLIADLQALDNNYKLGFKFKDNYYEAVKVLNSDGSIEVGLLVTDIPVIDFNENVTVSLFLELNGSRYETAACSKTVKEIINIYLTDFKDDISVKNHLGILTYLKNR